MIDPSNSSPATESVESDATIEDESASTEDTESSPKRSIWNRLFGGLTKDAETEETGVNEESTASTESSNITLTQEQFDRYVQAETDRREAKRLRENSERADQEHRAAIQRKLDPNSPDYDPYAGTEEQAKIKAAEERVQQFTGLLQSVGQTHDTATLDHLVNALPAADRDRIMKLDGAGVGLEGRALIVKEGLKALEKHWKAQGAREAETKLSGDQIFRKKVFSEFRGQTEEPELIAGTPKNGNGSGDFMDNILDEFRAAKGRRRR